MNKKSLCLELKNFEFALTRKEKYVYTNRLLLLLFLLLLLLLKDVGSARMRESDIHLISPKTPAPQYQPIDRKRRKGKIVETNSRDRAALANKKSIGPALETRWSTPSNTGSAKSFQRDTERGIKVLRYCKVLQRGGA